MPDPAPNPGQPAPLTSDEAAFITEDTPSAEPTPQPDDKPKPAPEPVEPGKSGSPPETPEPKPDTPPTEPEIKPDTHPADKPDDPMDTEVSDQLAPKALRAAVKKLKVERREMYLELTKLKEAASKPPTPADDPERKALEEKFTTADKRRQELEDHIKFIDYTKSDEYQQKYHKPYIETWQNAAQLVSELKIVNGETGESRQATEHDLSEIVKITNSEDALTAAEALFGTPAKAMMVMNLREAIRKSYLAGEKAKAEFREQGSARQKEWEVGETRKSEARATMFQQLNKDAAEKFPHLFKPVDGDKEGNALLEKGFKEADLAFSGTLTPEQQVPLHSALRNKAAVFYRLNRDLKRANTRADSAEQKLKKYQESEPKPTTGAPGVPAVDEDNLDAEFERRSIPGY